MQITLALNLPRDEISVPVARRIVDTSMRAVGVAPGIVDDVTLALSEACTNVLQHSGPGDEYEMTVRLTGTTCAIEVRDLGEGLDSSIQRSMAAPDAERGRGVHLMNVLVDRIDFRAEEGSGNVVVMEKNLDYVDGSLIDRARS